MTPTANLLACEWFRTTQDLNLGHLLHYLVSPSYAAAIEAAGLAYGRAHGADLYFTKLESTLFPG